MKIVRLRIQNYKSIKDIDITIEADAPAFAHYLEKNTDCRIIAVQENLKTVKIEFQSGAVIDFASFENVSLQAFAYFFLKQHALTCT